MYKYSTNGKKPFFIAAVLSLAILLLNPNHLKAQERSNETYRLSLSEVITFAKSQNKLVLAANVEETAVAEDRKDSYRNALPTVYLNGSYQRFSKLTLFTGGLSHTVSGARKPSANGAALGIDALFNVYSGGKQRALEKEADLRLSLAGVAKREQAGSVALKTAKQYLDLIRLIDLHRFILDQLKRADTRLKNINSLYKNHKITKSDLLRAEVAMSNVELSLGQNENDISIANQKLNVLINIPASVIIVPADSAGMQKPEIGSLMSLLGSDEVSSYVVQKASSTIELQKAKVGAVKSGNLPNVGLYGAYGLNYPNYLFFPPVDQAYSIGFVGLKVQYSISSLYQSKNKVSAAKLRLKVLEMQKEAYVDDVRIEMESYYIKYAEALKRISVNEHSVEQAQVNFRIVNTKYLNQLSLLTDLLDADNLYQESRFNLVSAQTDAMGIYYSMLFASGSL
ncbi:outer membrane protein [Pedobacter sp. W3I1]|uniref:TolC family protein n=1 Tax=Pedobacter sp. W3I1 TaxID=3042291 RepID=UPI0027860916|nr:TolC family protein [Pedobacter sp. W3I1]MDQ0640291.1 outer membrane protein [Pedobacter sp. W3I1]